MHCPGPWDPLSGKQSAPDTCMPMKVGECWNVCPVQCNPETDQVCPGHMPEGSSCPVAGTCMPNDCKFLNHVNILNL